MALKSWPEDSREIVADMDSGEDIEVQTRPLAAIPQLIAAGEIHHALVINAFWWLAQRHGGQVHPQGPVTE